MIEFVKMQGIGNDFVVLDALKVAYADLDLPSFARNVCDRRLGVGGDGVLLLERGHSASLAMRMWNPDGSESEMCGNGLRCVAALARDRGYATGSADFETGAGVLHAKFVDDLVSIDMGIARLAPAEIGMVGPTGSDFIEQDLGDGTLATAVSMGNPHLVQFVNDVRQVDLERTGRTYEHQAFFPSKTNVHFVEVRDRQTLVARVWERGAGATLACGTGACAIGVAGFVTGRSEASVTVHLPGGPLRIQIDHERRVTMTGAAVTVFEGVIDFNANLL